MQVELKVGFMRSAGMVSLGECVGEEVVSWITSGERAWTSIVLVEGGTDGFGERLGAHKSRSSFGQF